MTLENIRGFDYFFVMVVVIRQNYTRRVPFTLIVYKILGGKYILENQKNPLENNVLCNSSHLHSYIIFTIYDHNFNGADLKFISARQRHALTKHEIEQSI